MAPTSSIPNVRGNFQEVFFAQRLADNEKTIRDRALKRLKGYLSVKSSRGPGFSDDDALKIWKGLFYCMYMADKPLVQEEVAEKLSLLIHDLENLEDRRTFTKAAFRTFAREWEAIDNYRMDKFMMTMRRVLRQMLIHLKQQEWNLKEVAAYVNILDTYVIRPDDDIHATPLGIKLHLCGIIMEELAKIGCEELKHDVIVAFIQPYMKVLALSRVDTYREAVAKNIFQHLIKQSDLGIEREKLGLPDDEEEEVEDVSIPDEDEVVDGVEENDSLDEEGEDDFRVAEGDTEDAEDDEDMEENGCEKGIPSVLDPRAGDVHACIPQIYPDFNLLANALLKIGSIETVTKKNRALIYKLVAELQDIAQNIYPLNRQEERMEDPDKIQAVNYNEHKEKLKKFYEDLRKPGKTDKIEIGEIKKDPLSKYSVQSLEFVKRRKKKKFQKGKKVAAPIKEKYERAKTQKERDSARKRAVENLISQITEVAILPEDASKKKKKQHTGNNNNQITTKVEILSKKKKKKARGKKMEDSKGDQSRGFEVSDIASDVQLNGISDRSKYPSRVSQFEVSPIPSVKKDDSKRKNESEHEEERPKKSQKVLSMGNSSVTVKPITDGHPQPNVQKKKKKKKAKAGGEPVDLKNDSTIRDQDIIKSVVSQVESSTPGKFGKREVRHGNDTLTNSSPIDKPGTSHTSKKLDVSCLKISSKTKKMKKNKNMQGEPKGNKVSNKSTVGMQDDIDVGKQFDMTEKNEQVNGEKNGQVNGLSVKSVARTPESKLSKTSILETPKVAITKASKSPSLQTPNSSVSETPKGQSSKTFKLSSSRAKSMLNQALKSQVTKTPKLKDTITPNTSLLKTPTKGASVKENKLILNFGEIPTPSVWSKPIPETEIDIFIKSKRLMKSGKKAKKSAGILSPKGTPKTPRDKTIKINLKQNQEHDFKDYVASVRNSPQIPFRADKLPKAPVLKPSPSPILLKRPALKILKNFIRKSPGGQTPSPLAKKSPKSKKMKRSKASDFF
ncbi:Ribosomal RNA processing protein 1 B [Halocaridina rubra]|uniref:Ribosomal RNA processing protein 1 B n=1 Tax=Halocaridina rubra TaxID=373956 RepID=A0AAN9AEQ2_HALRR